MFSISNSISTAATLFALFCISALPSDLARAQDVETTKAVLLRAEVRTQYQQVYGSVRRVDGGTEVCVPWTVFENTPSGNTQDGLLHCHSRITHPIPLGVQVAGDRVVLPIAVGNEASKIQTIVDTGSDGLTLNAFQIFPAGMVTSDGFNFNGEDQIRYKGITVTKLVATRDYGSQSANPTSRTGNLGFAHISLGEDGKLRTALIPILFVYTSTDQPSAMSASFDNLIGINGGLAPIGSQVTYDGLRTQSSSSSQESASEECTVKSQAACSLISPLRAFSYDDGTQAGYIFHDLPLINGQQGNYLTVGLDDRNSKGFATAQLQCTTTSLEVESCNQEVRNVHVVSSKGLDFYWNVIFDSGRPSVGIVVPTDSINPPAPVILPAGITFTITPPTQTDYEYTFTTGIGLSNTTRTYVNRDAADAPQTFSNMGLGFFATNSLLLDYDNGIEGWKPARNSD